MEGIKMTKTEQKPETMKTGFLLDEYSQLVLDLEFLIATLQVATDHESEVFDATPIYYEALNKALATKALIEKIRPERQGAA
jgi:hypothetical protein